MRVNFRIYTRKLSIIGKSSQWGWSSLQPVPSIDKEIAPEISGTYRKSAHKSGAKFIKESPNCGSWVKAHSRYLERGRVEAYMTPPHERIGRLIASSAEPERILAEY